MFLDLAIKQALVVHDACLSKNLAMSVKKNPLNIEPSDACILNHENGFYIHSMGLKSSSTLNSEHGYYKCMIHVL